jgi:hypothetical protein
MDAIPGTWQAKASLSPTKTILSKKRRTAGTGPRPMVAGSQPATAQPDEAAVAPDTLVPGKHPRCSLLYLRRRQRYHFPLEPSGQLFGGFYHA